MDTNNACLLAAEPYIFKVFQRNLLSNVRYFPDPALRTVTFVISGAIFRAKGRKDGSVRARAHTWTGAYTQARAWA